MINILTLATTIFSIIMISYKRVNLEILKKLIAEYEKNNPTKDRPKVRKFFE